MTCRARSDRRLIRDRYRSNRFVLVEMTAPESRRALTREPLNLAFVLDRSGSMSGRKIELAREAITQGIRSLHESDRFCVVAYDNEIDVIAESRLATTAAREEALARVARIDSRGSTNLFEGWMRGCQQVASNLAARDVNRCLVLSDGLANIGVTDPNELEKHAGELRQRGVATWTFGVGADFDHQLLERMAVAGGGQSYFIERPEQIPDYITSAVGEALDVVLRDVRIEVDAPGGIVVEPLTRFVHRANGDRTVVDVGDLVSGQRMDIVLRVNFPFGDVGGSRTAVVQVKDRDGVHQHQPVELTWDYADNRANDDQPRDLEVDRHVAALYAARAKQDAVLFNQQGSYKLAMEAISGTANRISGYAGNDPQLNATLNELREASSEVAAPMQAMAAKEMHFASSYALRSRDMEGKAKR